MNPWQMAQQIKHELQLVAWTEGSESVVFGQRGVVIFAGSPTEEQIPAGFPWALVGVGPGSPDQDHPEFLEQQFQVVIGAEVAGDPQGEFAIIGGATAELGRSAGRGVGEIAERARSAVQALTGADGAKILLTAISTGSPVTLGRGRHLALSDLSLTALCTSQLHYAAPQQAAYSGGTWTWQGSHCSDRFDFLQYRLVEKSGSSPSASPTDGTIVYTGTDATSTATQTAGNTYTVFAEYNARGGPDAEGNSDAEIGSYVVA